MVTQNRRSSPAHALALWAAFVLIPAAVTAAWLFVIAVALLAGEVMLIIAAFACGGVVALVWGVWVSGLRSLDAVLTAAMTERLAEWSDREID